MRKPAPEWIPPEIIGTQKLPLYKKQVDEYYCTLVTPLYGGGVTAGKVDEKMPIRATTIRGQLRFWWRIAHRNRYVDENKKLDTEAMFRDERDIWGGLGDSDSLTASKVMVSVRDIQHKALEACASYDRKNDGSLKTFPTWKAWAGSTVGGYALFPGQGKASRVGVETEPAKLLKPDATWILEIQYSDDCRPEHQEQVATALRWWTSFGSVGGRGRRGLGAVKVEDLPSITAKEARECGCILVLQGDKGMRAIEAWKASLQTLQNFRQGKGIGRNPGSEPNRPGRSRWPEPDAIRRITKKNATAHRPEHPAENLFPRAQFGLPIIFHFKDRDDPQDATLKPMGAERMSSPIFLRPYFKQDEDQWVPAALCIKPEVVELELNSGRTSATVQSWPKNEADQQVAVDRIHPLSGVLKGLNKKPQKPLSPLNAFLNYFKDPDKYFNGNKG